MSNSFDPYDWEYTGDWEFETEKEAHDAATDLLFGQEVIEGVQYVGGGDYEAPPAEDYTIEQVLDRFEAIAGGDQPFNVRFSRIGTDENPKLYFSFEVYDRFVNSE